MSDPDPDPGDLQLLHEALLAGADPTAPARMAELLMPALHRRFSGRELPDPHAVTSLVGLSIARYLAKPARWRPERGPLLAFLWQDVAGDIKNERDSRARLRQHELPDSAAVELFATDQNLSVEEEVLDDMDPFDMAQALAGRALDAISGFSQQDRELVELLGAGVRSTSPYAEVLGITHLPEPHQAKEVKRHKDRLNKRLGVVRGQLERAD